LVFAAFCGVAAFCAGVDGPAHEGVWGYSSANNVCREHACGAHPWIRGEAAEHQIYGDSQESR